MIARSVAWVFNDAETKSELCTSHVMLRLGVNYLLHLLGLQTAAQDF